MSVAEAVAETIRGRRTIHSFKPECPPFERIREAIDLARWAPNHHHTEPWRFLHAGPETKAKIVDLNARIVSEKKGRDAGEAKRLRWSEIPGWLIVACDRSDDMIRYKEDYAACCCAIQNLSLALWTHDIGVKWTTGAVTRDAEFYELLGLNRYDHTVVGLLWYGYFDQPPAQRRKDTDEILCQLK